MPVYLLLTSAVKCVWMFECNIDVVFCRTNQLVKQCRTPASAFSYSGQCYIEPSILTLKVQHRPPWFCNSSDNQTALRNQHWTFCSIENVERFVFSLDRLGRQLFFSGFWFLSSANATSLQCFFQFFNFPHNSSQKVSQTCFRCRADLILFPVKNFWQSSSDCTSVQHEASVIVWRGYGIFIQRVFYECFNVKLNLKKFLEMYIINRQKHHQMHNGGMF